MNRIPIAAVLIGVVVFTSSTGFAGENAVGEIFHTTILHRVIVAHPDLAKYNMKQLLYISDAKDALKKFYEEIDANNSSASLMSSPSGEKYFDQLMRYKKNNDAIDGFRVLNVAVNPNGRVVFGIDLTLSQPAWSCVYQGTAVAGLSGGKWKIYDPEADSPALEEVESTIISDKKDDARQKLINEIADPVSLVTSHREVRPVEYSDSQFSALAGAKATLKTFLESVNRGDDIARQYLEGRALKKYPHPENILDNEESILSFTLVDTTSLQSDDEAHLDFEVRFEEEGSICTYLEWAILKKTHGSWIISDLSNLANEHGVAP